MKLSRLGPRIPASFFNTLPLAGATICKWWWLRHAASTIAPSQEPLLARDNSTTSVQKPDVGTTAGSVLLNLSIIMSVSYGQLLHTVPSACNRRRKDVLPSHSDRARAAPAASTTL